MISKDDLMQMLADNKRLCAVDDDGDVIHKLFQDTKEQWWWHVKADTKLFRRSHHNGIASSNSYVKDFDRIHRILSKNTFEACTNCKHNFACLVVPSVIRFFEPAS